MTDGQLDPKTGGGGENNLFIIHTHLNYMRGMRGRRLPVGVAGVCERFIPLGP